MMYPGGNGKNPGEDGGAITLTEARGLIISRHTRIKWAGKLLKFSEKILIY